MSRPAFALAKTLFLTAVVVATVAVAPVTAASAAPVGTGTVVLEIVGLTGHRIESIDAKAHIGITAADSSFSGSAAPHRGASNYRGRISHGRFVFTKIPTGVNFTAWGTDVGGAYLPASVDGYSITPGKKLTIKLPLAKGASVSGTITTSKGKPINGAVAALLSGGSTVVGQPIARTNAKGKFTIVGVPSGSYMLQFNTRYAGLGKPTANYGWSYWHSLTEAGSPEFRLNAQSPGVSATVLTKRNGTVAAGFSVRGTTAFANAPVGTTVWLQSTDNDLDYAWGLVAQNGSFSLRAIPGTYTLHIIHDGNYWYYTGDGNAPSTNPADAVAIGFTGTANLAVAMGAVAP